MFPKPIYHILISSPVDPLYWLDTDKAPKIGDLIDGGTVEHIYALTRTHRVLEVICVWHRR
jgi:hypothetical protein